MAGYVIIPDYIFDTYYWTFVNDETELAQAVKDHFTEKPNEIQAQCESSSPANTAE